MVHLSGAYHGLKRFGGFHLSFLALIWGGGGDTLLKTVFDFLLVARHPPLIGDIRAVDNFTETEDSWKKLLIFQ